jgi:glutamate-5-semialdehyde dehydrogenase
VAERAMTEKAISDLLEKGRAAQAASRKLARLPTADKNRALLNIAEALKKNQGPVLAANEQDVRIAQTHGLDNAIIDRLMLSPKRLLAISQDVNIVAALPDPVGQTTDMATLPNGLNIGKRRVPLGVIGSIYESRPNVTIDISALCLKSGNACILRGGKESINSNTALINLVHQALTDARVPIEAVQFVSDTDRMLIDTMLHMKSYINLIIPRGGSDLIRFVVENASMPTVTGGIGVCHTYVDRTADLDKADKIIFNAKVQRPTVCNALDTILLNAEVAPTYLPVIARHLALGGVELHCDPEALIILGSNPDLPVIPATKNDWGKEFLSLVAAIKIVDSLDEALDHIETYGSGHSEAIVTEDYTSAMRFLDEIDAAAVYVNASTRFTDGAQFGLGGEVGVSTQKFHARGPMGLTELTSYKWVIMGNGQIRE